MVEETRYFFVDIETDGPTPGPCSMLNLAIVVTDEAIDEIDSFTINLEPLSGAKGDPETLSWWKSKPDIWQAITENAVPVDVAMNRFSEFVRSYDYRRIFIGHPIAFDGYWVGHYMQSYLGQGLMAFHGTKDPLFFGAGIDMPSYIAGGLGIDYGSCRHGRYPPEIATDLTHNHIGLDDARGHADVFRKATQLMRINSRQIHQNRV